MNFQLKGFYSEQDQDMRINLNGDVDMRSLPLLPPKADLPAPLKPAEITEASTKMDVDIRNVDRLMNTIQSPFKEKDGKKGDISDSSGNMERDLTIDEKSGK